MENLTILSTNISKSAKEVINGNTVNYSWSYEENSKPVAINFNIQRGEVGAETFTGNNAITGNYYPDSNKFDVVNNGFTDGDFDVYELVLLRCKELADE